MTITLKTLQTELEYLSIDTIIREFTELLTEKESANMKAIVDSTPDGDDNGVRYMDVSADSCLTAYIECGYTVKELYNMFDALYS